MVTSSFSRGFHAPLCLLALVGSFLLTSPARAQQTYADELRPHVVSLVDDGQLSSEGPFAGTPEDVRAILVDRVIEAAAASTHEEDPPPRAFLYAHGGLTDEAGGLWHVPRLTDLLMGDGIYPVVFVWHTDAGTILENLLRELLGRKEEAPPAPEGETLDWVLEWLSHRLGGQLVWGEMKENARLASEAPIGGARVAAEALVELRAERPDAEIHLAGHSAGSIFHAHLVKLLTDPVEEGGMGLRVDTCTLLAPAATWELFQATYLPALESGRLGRLRIFLLDDAHEQEDTTWSYGKSIMYLIRNALEPAVPTPLVGLARSYDEVPALARLRDEGRIEVVVAPNDLPDGHPAASRATTHGSFGGDEVTDRALRRWILQESRRKRPLEGATD